MSSSPSPADIQLGTFLSLGSPLVTELAAECGFQWLLLDLEHGASTDATLLPQLMATKGATTKAIVRFGTPHADQVLRALDWGAHGIMIPRVSSVAEAENCVKAASYAPRGHRGFSRSARTYGLGLRPPTSAGSIPQPLIMAQIENIEGVAHAGEIAAVDGVDVLFVGPADLQFDLAARPELANLTYEECLVSVASAAQSAGKACGILLRDATEIPKFRDLGYTYLALDSDVALLRKGFLALANAARKLPGVLAPLI